MGMLETCYEIEKMVYTCLKDNKIDITLNMVRFNHNDYSVLKVEAQTKDNIEFVFKLGSSHVVSKDKKYAFDIKPYKHRKKDIE